MDESLTALSRILDTPLVQVGGSVLRLGSAIALVAVLTAFEVLIRGLERAAERFASADGSGPDDRMPLQLQRLVRWPLSVVGLLTAIRIAGLNPKFIHDFMSLPLFSIRGTPLTPSTLLTFAVLVFLTWWISRLAQKGVTRSMQRRKGYEEGTIAVTRRLLHYAVMLVGLGVALETVGIDLSVLFAAGAVFAVGFGFALQNIAENFVSGLLLLLEGSIKPGDVIELDGELVKVRRMNIRTTVVHTLDDEDIIVPNSTLVQSAVRNLTYDNAIHRVRTTVGVAYESDMARVEVALFEAAEGHSMRDPQRPPVINLLRFADSSVEWEVSVRINQPIECQGARSELNRRIFEALRRARITIAYPQLEMRVVSPPRGEAT